MLSDLRRRKFATMFGAADINDNGVLDRGDFLAVAEKFSARNGWEEGSDDYAGMYELCAGWWEAMRANADIDGDGIVTLEEFCATLEDYDEAAFVPTAHCCSAHSTRRAMASSPPPSTAASERSSTLAATPTRSSPGSTPTATARSRATSSRSALPSGPLARTRARRATGCTASSDLIPPRGAGRRGRTRAPARGPGQLSAQVLTVASRHAPEVSGPAGTAFEPQSSRPTRPAVRGLSPQRLIVVVRRSRRARRLRIALCLRKVAARLDDPWIRSCDGRTRGRCRQEPREDLAV